MSADGTTLPATVAIPVVGGKHFETLKFEIQNSLILQIGFTELYYLRKKIIMVAIVGTYQNGYVKLDKEYYSNNPVKVILTFLDEVPTQSEKGLSLSDFSFAESQKNLENFKGSFSDTVIQERRLEL